MSCGFAATCLLGVKLPNPQAEACPPQGAWAWRLKDRIDRKWMAGYGAGLPRMVAAPPDHARRGRDAVAAAAGPEAWAALAADRMRCGGCGAKVLKTPCACICCGMPVTWNLRAQLRIER